MSDEQKTVFISYRRTVASFIARSIFLDLRASDYDVFMDVESIDSGDFEQIIFNQIEARAHFLVILTPGTIERYANPGDMMRREIKYAMEKQRNIIPLLVNGFEFNDASRKFLTGELAELSRYNGTTVTHEYFNEAMARLRNRFLKRPVYGVIKSAPINQQSTVQQKIEDVTSQPPPTERELSAEELFLIVRSKKQSSGDFDGALTDLDQAIRLDSQSSNIYNNRGAVWIKKANLSKALADFNQAILLDPQNVDAYNNRGIVRLQQGDIDNALADFDETIRIDPEYANVYTNRGNLYMDAGNIDKALADFEQAVRFDSQDVGVFIDRGRARVEKGDLDRAITDFEQAIYLDPQNASIYDNRGIAYFKKDNLDNALIDFDQAIHLAPQGARSYSNRGVARRYMRDMEGAKADFDRAIQLDPQDASAYNNRGAIHAESGDIDAALADYNKSIRLDSNNASIYYNRGRVYLKSERPDKARKDFSRANNLSPADEKVLVGLAVSHYMLGRKTEAKRIWRALLVDKDNFQNATWVGKQFDWGNR